jgi:hypothetical protein
MAKTNYKKLAKNATTAVNLLDKFASEPKEENRVSLPPMIPVADLEGRTVGGKIVSIQMKKSRKKGESDYQILTLKHKSGEVFCIVMAAAIKYALARHLEVDEESFAGEGAEGLNLDITGKGKGRTKDGKRAVNLFDIYISK